MSKASKMRAISKAMRCSRDNVLQPGKTYMVSKKKGPTNGIKGIKLVDKCMKQNAQRMALAKKKRSHSKQGGLTRSKKQWDHW